MAFLIFVLFFGLGILFWGYYAGKAFDNENLIVLDFVATIGFPGLMGIVTAAIVAASMSSLDSSLNSMATVTTLDFYEKFVKKGASAEHYLVASRWFTFMWAILMVVPAIMFTKSGGSVIEILSKLGSFLVGAKLSMFGLGFFSKHTSQRGLMFGVAAGFLSLAYVEYYMDIAWPWYAALGGVISISVAWVMSVLLDGFQDGHHPYTIKGQQRKYREEGLAEKQDGWYVVAGKVDRPSWVMLGYFFVCVLALWIADSMI